MKLEYRRMGKGFGDKIEKAAIEKTGVTGWVMGACPNFRLLSNLYQNENKIRDISFFHLKPLYHTEFLIVKYLTVLFFLDYTLLFYQLLYPAYSNSYTFKAQADFMLSPPFPQDLIYIYQIVSIRGR